MPAAVDDDLGGLYSGLPEPDPAKDQAFAERQKQKVATRGPRLPPLPAEDVTKASGDLEGEQSEQRGRVDASRTPQFQHRCHSAKRPQPENMFADHHAIRFLMHPYLLFDHESIWVIFFSIGHPA